MALESCSAFHPDPGRSDRLVDINELLGTFDDDDYDNIIDADDIESIAESLRSPKRKQRKVSSLPEKFSIICKRATDLVLQGRYEDALTAYQDVAVGVKNYAPVFNWMAECYQNLGQLEEAFDCCRKATSIDRQFPEAWNRYLELAEILNMEDNVVIGLKAIIALNIDSPETVIPLLHRLVNFLTKRRSSTTLRFQRILFQMEMQLGRKPDCYLVAAAIARNLIDAEKFPAALQFLQEPMETAIREEDEIPEETVQAYVEALIGTKHPDEAASTLLRCKVMKLAGPPDLQTFHIGNAVSATVEKETCTPLVAAVCYVMTKFDNFSVVKKLISKRILEAEHLPKSRVFLDLAIILLEKGETELARNLLTRLQSQAEFQSPEFYFYLGTALEQLGNIKQALDAYNRALSLRPSFRSARFRIRSLGLPVPTTINLGTAEQRVNTINVQKDIFNDILERRQYGEDLVLLSLAIDLVTATFSHMEELNCEEILYEVASPYRIDLAVKDYILYAPAIATNDIKLEDFWEVVVDGCHRAVKLGKFDDLMLVAFHGICTADLIQEPERVNFLRDCIIVAAYRLGNVDYCIKYYRDFLMMSKTNEMSVVEWNFFYLLASQRKSSHSHALFKWALRRTRIYGYSRELFMIMANDSMRRGNHRHAFELYFSILAKEGLDNAPWYVLLHLGVLYLNLATRCHCRQRLVLYNSGMVMLHKYGERRGMCPEVLFNKGRAAQHFGDVPSASKYYRECIEMQQKVKTRNCSASDLPLMDYSFKAAYNLRALYENNQQIDRGKDLLKTTLSWKKIREIGRKGDAVDGEMDMDES